MRVLINKTCLNEEDVVQLRSWAISEGAEMMIIEVATQEEADQLHARFGDAALCEMNG
jgi:hypothetical protein